MMIEKEWVIVVGEPVELGRRLGWSILALVFAVILFLCTNILEAREEQLMFWFPGFILLLAASFSPLHTVKQLDPVQG